MLDRSAFDPLVHEALSHLYDFPFLESSALAETIGLRDRGEGGIALHRLLVDAIERLKPSRDVSPESAAWKNYRSLQLRYIRSLSAGAVARELGLSARQAQRIHASAVASIAALLRETHRPRMTRPPSDPAGPTRAVLPAEVPPMPDLVLDEELAAIRGGDQPDPEPFPTTLRGAIDTIEPILAARQSTVELSIADELSSRIGPRHLIRPAIVQLLLAAVDGLGAARALVAATLEGTVVQLAIDALDRERPLERVAGTETFEGRLRVARRLLNGIDAEIQIGPGPPPRIVARLPLDVAPCVLVVEDNPQVARLLERYLSGSSFRMLSAPNGVVGFEVAKAAKPSAITLDVLMPQSDGWELLQSLKVHPETRRIPVIVCSVLRERELALALGASDFLPKPVTQRAFLGALERVVTVSARALGAEC